MRSLIAAILFAFTGSAFAGDVIIDQKDVISDSEFNQKIFGIFS